MEEEDDLFMLQYVTNMLQELPLVQTVKDVCYWSIEEEEGFTVKSCALKISKRGEGLF